MLSIREPLANRSLSADDGFQKANGERGIGDRVPRLVNGVAEQLPRDQDRYARRLQVEARAERDGWLGTDGVCASPGRRREQQSDPVLARADDLDSCVR